MPIELSELIRPTVFSIELATIISLFIISIGFAGIKMRNGIIIFFWMLSVIVLVIIFILQLNFIWFWLMIIISVIVIGIAAIVRFL